ncbi:MAG TPA: hypothetical protein VEI82_00285 [Myxococcota bacterium]|nr:hypothetical protein [Myxococcota bacterium]
MRARAEARIVRPILLVELARNRVQAGADAGDAWRAAAAALGRRIEVFSGASLAEIPATRFAAWILPGQEELDAADFAALDAYLQLGGGAVLSGRSGTLAPGRSPLARLFPGQRFSELQPGVTRLRVTGPGPLVAGIPAGAEIALAKPGRALAASANDALAWDVEAGAAGLQEVYLGAPVVWLGFAPDQVVEPELARTLAENALRYALREPLLDLRAWPEGRPCAVLVDAPNGAGADTSACRVEGDESDEALRALVRAGCRFASVSADARALPEIKELDGTPLVAIPESRASASAHGSELLRQLLAGYERAERLGGIYSLRTEPSWKTSSRDLARVRDELRARGAWFARPDELAGWWRARSSVRAELSVVARDRMRVTLANPGGAEARGVTARVYLPDGADTARLESGPRFRTAPLLRVSADHTWIELVEARLDPGSEVSYTIRF